MNSLTTSTDSNFLYNDKSIREQARIMYLADDSCNVTTIASTFGVSVEEAKYFIYGKDGSGRSKKCWHQIKKNLTDASIIAVMADQRHVVEHTGKIALDLIMRTLKKIHKEVAIDDRLLSIQDLKDISEIFSKMDKIVRLDSGLATEIRQNLNLTVEQKTKIATVVGRDPFTAKSLDGDIEDVEYEELGDE